MIDVFMISEAIRIDIDQIMKTRDSINKIEVDLGMNKITEGEV